MSFLRVPTNYVLSRNMKNISLLSENVLFLKMKFIIYLNRRAFVMHNLSWSYNAGHSII